MEPAVKIGVGGKAGQVLDGRTGMAYLQNPEEQPRNATHPGVIVQFLCNSEAILLPCPSSPISTYLIALQATP